jgi:peroxiredoxin
LASLGQTFNEWVGQETGAGRIGIVTDGAGAFGYAMGVCVGLQGGADIIRADDESLIFYFETGQAVPPGGVCDA